jgi:hypothetical protein
MKYLHIYRGINPSKLQVCVESLAIGPNPECPGSKMVAYLCLCLPWWGMRMDHDLGKVRHCMWKARYCTCQVPHSLGDKTQYTVPIKEREEDAISLVYVISSPALRAARPPPYAMIWRQALQPSSLNGRRVNNSLSSCHGSLQEATAEARDNQMQVRKVYGVEWMFIFRGVSLRPWFKILDFSWLYFD